MAKYSTFRLRLLWWWKEHEGSEHLWNALVTFVLIVTFPLWLILFFIVEIIESHRKQWATKHGYVYLSYSTTDEEYREWKKEVKQAKEQEFQRFCEKKLNNA